MSNVIVPPPLALPVPDSATLCGLPAALSLTLTFAARLPVAVGLKVTEIVQVAFTASDAGQSLVCVKSPGFVPVSVTLLMVSGAVPVLRRDDVCAALVEPTICGPKTRLPGVSVTAEAVPVPLRLMGCGLPDALSVTFTAAVRLPVAAGVKVTLMVQVALAARLAGQSLDCAKSAALVPATAIALIVSGPVPVFRRVEACGALVAPTPCEPKARVAGVSVTAGAGPPPP